MPCPCRRRAASATAMMEASADASLSAAITRSRASGESGTCSKPHERQAVGGGQHERLLRIRLEKLAIEGERRIQMERDSLGRPTDIGFPRERRPPPAI